jgi:hypothetical protein
LVLATLPRIAEIFPANCEILMTIKIFLHGIPDHLQQHGEVRPSLSTVYKLSSLGELPPPTDYFGSRPRFDADAVLTAWRARVRKQTQAALERAEQSRQYRRERLERLKRQAEAAGKNASQAA